MPGNKKDLRTILKKYETHPQFLGDTILSPNQCGDFGDTPLHLASSRGDVGDIEELVAAGAKINMPGDMGNTPLHQAAMMGRVSAVEILLRLGADFNARNEDNQTPLEVAVLGDKSEVISVLKKFLNRK